GIRFLVYGDHGRIDRLCGRKAVRPEEDLQEFLEGHLVDVLVHRNVGLDRAGLVLDRAALDLDRDAEPLERLVDLLVDVRLLLGRVLRAISRLVEVAAGRACVERSVNRILPVRLIGILLGVLRIALRRSDPTVSLAGRLDGADHRIPGDADQAKGSTARRPACSDTSSSASIAPAPGYRNRDDG